MNNDRQPGYILVLTLMILSIAIIIVTQVYHRSSIQVHFDHTIIQQHQAYRLARGGVEIAIAQLKKPKKKVEKKEGTQADEPKESQSPVFNNVLPHLNRWVSYSLTQKQDGVTGTVRVCITSEEGKINLNEWFDFKEKKFKNEGQKTDDRRVLLASLCARPSLLLGGKDLFSELETALKKHDQPLDDVTLLMDNALFQNVFKRFVFYGPPSGKKTVEKNQTVYLTDIFTTWSPTDMLNPWLFSNSVAALLSLEPAISIDMAARTTQLKEITKDTLPTGNLPELWQKALQKLYKKEFTSLPKGIESVLKDTYEPTVFGILASGTVGSITQNVYAIVYREGMQFITKKVYIL